jgi:hypothetical protein
MRAVFVFKAKKTIAAATFSHKQAFAHMQNAASLLARLLRMPYNMYGTIGAPLQYASLRSQA